MRAPVLFLAAVIAAGFVAATETAPTTAAEPSATDSITLKWEARNENAVYGYLIYRADRRQGPFLRINTEILHVEEPAMDDASSSYEYIDATVTPGSTYFYYLDTISKGGFKTRFSGVIKKTAPGTPEPAQDTR